MRSLWTVNPAALPRVLGPFYFVYLAPSNPRVVSRSERAPWAREASVRAR